ncbi:MAG TPA: hypothetical protein VKG44_08400 [Candidatus Baltobacteraceae bacterium]|nr:hypothetical protein [Candidatus Baltobacteraceae bacterium]
MKTVRIAGRLTLAVVIAALVALVATQFAGIVGRNVAVGREVAASRAELDALRAKKHAQLRAIARLSDPGGAIPEIHDKLKLVGPHEELIFVQGLPSPSPGPEDER